MHSFNICVNYNLLSLSLSLWVNYDKTIKMTFPAHDRSWAGKDNDRTVKNLGFFWTVVYSASLVSQLLKCKVKKGIWRETNFILLQYHNVSL